MKNNVDDISICYIYILILRLNIYKEKGQKGYIWVFEENKLEIKKKSDNL